MKTPAIPPDEPARLESLRSLDILDTLADERFDRVTRMAKRLFGVPIALVSLVDENRQWFKSCIGLDVGETSRDVSFCGHAILGDGVFMIHDAQADERFADNPLVVDDPYIRFYAGHPLTAPDGSKLGTLCIIDRAPRSLDEDALDALKDLAAMVEGELAAIQLATLDELTKVSNRRGFMMLAQHSLRLCAREKIPAALVFIDLDQFKPINDRFGHAEGDVALRAFARELKRVSRDSDVVARLAGDEFVALLGNTTKPQAEKLLTERFRQSLDRYNREANRDYAISFSHGIVEFDPDRHAGIDALLSDGDALMYQLKKSRKQSR